MNIYVFGKIGLELYIWFFDDFCYSRSVVEFEKLGDDYNIGFVLCIDIYYLFFEDIEGYFRDIEGLIYKFNLLIELFWGFYF